MKQLVIHDQKMTEIEDVGKNFYLKETDVGVKTRLQASIEELKKLNPNVMVEEAENKDAEFM